MQGLAGCPCSRTRGGTTGDRPAPGRTVAGPGCRVTGKGNAFCRGQWSAMLALGAVHEQVTVTRPEDPPPQHVEASGLLPLERNKVVPALREAIRPSGSGPPAERPQALPAGLLPRPTDAAPAGDPTAGEGGALCPGWLPFAVQTMPRFVLLETAICSFQTEMAVFLIYVHYVSFPPQWLAPGPSG